MRLYPPVQFDSKFCQEDDTLPDGTFVKKGTRVTYHPYAMGRMERIWGPDCLEFKPERWLENGVFRPVSPFKYPVFQAGVRVCLGKELATGGDEKCCSFLDTAVRYPSSEAESNTAICSRSHCHREGLVFRS
ncbi:hypothetical protein Vadar_034154 [Vaccinium darrowii]|uniref:Uncharacterized protein n=1 Tax=Vaccinium darrowii TaxID=229202 RepID=A0ACB7ZGB0_9ERIC|nr:hypothetical protein Vadar_034154 [Vaccinium darrowii]